MPPAPQMSDYLYRHFAYQQFLGLALLIALLLAWLLLKFVRGHGVIAPAPLWAIVLIAAVIRLPLLFQSYWYDENFTSLVVRGSWSQFFSIVVTDVHPPGYYFVVKLFTLALGHHEIVMRLPAFISGLLLVVVIYHLASYAFYAFYTSAIWTALLAAILPAATYYSAEARYPAALALALAVALLGLQRQRYWLTSISLAAAASFHVNAWFTVGVFVVWLWWHRKWMYSLPGVAVILAWLPFAYVQSRDVVDGFWLQQSMPLRFAVDMTITNRFGDILPPVVVLLMIGVFMSVVAASVWKWRKRVSWLWLALVVIPPAAQWLTGLVLAPIYLPRTLLFSALLLLVPLGEYVAYHSTIWIRGAVVVCVTMAMFAIYSHDRSPADDVVSRCEDRIVYAGTTFSAIVASHYSDNVILWRDGETTAQDMSYDVRNDLWLLTDFEWLPEKDACFFTVVDSFTSQQQVDHLAKLVNEPEILYQNNYAYYALEIR